MDRDGVEVSLYVSTDEYAASTHGAVDCLECHKNFDPEELPHADDLTPADCSSCHARVTREFRGGRHQSALQCASCHGDVHETAKSGRDPASCVSCHGQAGTDMAASAHGSIPNAPTCFDCHDAHGASRVNSATCTNCHGERTLVDGEAGAERRDVVVRYESSIHKGIAECSDCHSGHNVRSSTDIQSPVHRSNISAMCASCHEEVVQTYALSEHGRALASGGSNAPACTDCHGEHDIRPVTDGQSPMSRLNQIAVCERCHVQSEAVASQMTHSTAFVGSYERSIHGKAVKEGNLEAAVCSDCHGAHEAMRASDPASKVHQTNLAETCGHCHAEVKEVFDISTHGVAVRRGNADAPTCATCHGEHEILGVADAESPVAAQNVSARVCGPCHEDIRLSSKYGFASGRTTSFSDSFHGLAGRLGQTEVANCVSCHGVHDILPSTDPRSMIHPDQLEVTCGSCHPGANANFARGTIHVVLSPEGDRLLYWIGTVYLLFILLTVGAMGAHNALDWYRKIKLTYQKRFHGEEHGAHITPLLPPTSETKAARLYVRMTRAERIQHLLMMVSFFTLVLTGFMLKFPDAFWVHWLRAAMGETVFGWRGIVHRVAAVVMVADTIYHLYYVIFVQRGRQFIRDIWFSRNDLGDMIGMLKYNLGRTQERPRFDRFNYIEKAEYWALVWGTAVMTITGFILWFNNQFMGWFSKLFVDVAETVHYWEAWLAFLAILIWHVYYVVFNPDVYPMNFAWITGKLTRHEMEHEHPLELERIDEMESREGGAPPLNRL